MAQDIHLLIESASVEEALSQASQQWGVPSGELSAEVVGEEKSFFGLFGKKLKVRIVPKKPLLLLKGREPALGA